MTNKARAHWGSKLGFVLAAAGSAIGLGNIWRFPFVTQQNGGGIFVLIYILFVAIIGFPVMLGELTIGRHTQKNPVGAYKSLAKGWVWLGYLCVAGGIGILSYYGVVAGWTVGYLVKSMTGDLDPQGFGKFLANAPLQIGYLVLFIGITGAVVAAGVQKGIERMSEVLLPLLFVLMIGLIIRAFTLPNAMEGLKFYLMPDFSKISASTFLAATGQAFFSLSLGMGAMITYGSYLDKKDNLVTSAIAVVSADTLIAILAGLLIFPVIGHGLGKGGPSLVFVTMIEQFSQMQGGQIVAILFFLLLAIAALTSTVSLMEVGVAYLVDEHGLSRPKAVGILMVPLLALGIPAALSLGAVDSLSNIVGGKGFLDIMDFVFGNLGLTIGALFMCIFLVYRWGIWKAAKEVLSGSPGFGKYVWVWKLLLGYVVPAFIVSLLVYNLYQTFAG